MNKNLIHFFKVYTYISLVAQMVKRLPAMRETWARFLGREDPLEKEMAIHSSTLAWKIPWMEESMGSQRGGHDWATSLHYIYIYSWWLMRLNCFSASLVIRDMQIKITMRYSYTPIRMAKIKMTIPSTEKDVEQLLVGTQKCQFLI